MQLNALPLSYRRHTGESEDVLCSYEWSVLNTSRISDVDIGFFGIILTSDVRFGTSDHRSWMQL